MNGIREAETTQNKKKWTETKTECYSLRQQKATLESKQNSWMGDRTMRSLGMTSVRVIKMTLEREMQRLEDRIMQRAKSVVKWEKTQKVTV